MTEREFATDVVRRLQEAGFTAYWAGGCVRDELLGIPPADHDVATDARPEQVRHIFKRTVEVGLSFGVIEVLGPKPLKIQVATFRNDGNYSDGRRPDSVEFSSAEEDAQRRDFTINGMFFDPIAKKLIDFVGGQQDLAAKHLRAIGNPVHRFAEDKLRMLRAVRMATRFDLEIDPATADAVRMMAGEIIVVSAERIAEELRKLLVHPRRARGMRLMNDLHLIPPILPELEEIKGLPYGPTGDLWQHVLKVLEVLAGSQWPVPEEVSVELAFAALMQDLGRRRTMKTVADNFTFGGHERVGKRMAAEITRRLKMSNIERTRIEWLTENHETLRESRQMRACRLKPILAHLGIGELLALHRANSLAAGRSVEHVEFCERKLLETPPEELNPPPLLNGDDLKEIGVAPGPRMKELLETVRDAQLDGLVGAKDNAIELVRRLLKGEPPRDP